jgi:hypothetical protein
MGLVDIMMLSLHMCLHQSILKAKLGTITCNRLMPLETRLHPDMRLRRYNRSKIGKPWDKRAAQRKH